MFLCSFCKLVYSMNARHEGALRSATDHISQLYSQQQLQNFFTGGTWNVNLVRGQIQLKCVSGNYSFIGILVLFR